MIDKPMAAGPSGAGATPALVWARTPERSTWAAEAAGAVLHVSRSVSGGWLASVTWQAGGAVRVSKLSGPLPTRRQAQAWAEREAGAR